MHILNLLVDKNQEISRDFTRLFSKVNSANVDADRPMEAQVPKIEEEFGEPSIQNMLVYSKKYDVLGTILSRRYVNSAKIHIGPLRLANMILLPDHISSLPNRRRMNRVLILAPHCDEAYIAAVLLHKLIDDQVLLYSFTSPKEEKNAIRQAYRTLGLKKDDYCLGSLTINGLFREKEAIKEIIREVLGEFKPTVVYSVFPKDAHSDHMAVAQVAREVVLNESTSDLIYGYVLQSRHKNPIIFPLFSKSVYGTILQAFGRQGFGKIFKRYLPFLKHYMQTYSEPLLRMIGDRKLSRVYSLPLEAERISDYKIPTSLIIAP